MEITNPSGMRAICRKIKGTELAALAEQADADDETANDGGFGAIIGGCWQEGVDPGPYTIVQPGPVKPSFASILKGDLIHSLLRLRAASVRTPDADPGPWGPGDAYYFPVMCESCKKQFEWELFLSDLPIRRLPDSSVEIMLRGGGKFTTTVGGRVYTFELQMPRQDGPMAKLRRQQKRSKATIVDTLTAQTMEIGGLPGARTNIKARYNHIAGLDFDELQDLQKAYEAADCGVETEIQVRCDKPACRWVQTVELPLGKGFFAPRRLYPAAIEETDDPIPSMGSSSDASSGASDESGGGESSIT